VIPYQAKVRSPRILHILKEMEWNMGERSKGDKGTKEISSETCNQ
jgi:hypothetical protein